MDERVNVDGGNDAFSSALGSILSDPEMMSMISSMAEKLKGSSEASKDTDAEAADFEANSERAKLSEDKPTALPSPKDLSGAMGALAPLLSGAGLKGSASDGNRACLLRALKPYLSKSRCEAIDHIITVSRLSELLKINEGRKNT
jgi:hypothetical protein